MSANVRNFIVGVVAIIALVGFAVLLMLFGELDDLATQRYDFHVHMNSAAGLREGSPVELNGVPVGRIEEIQLGSRVDYPVHILLRIEQAVQVPMSTYGRVQSQLIAGSSILQLQSHPVAPDEPVDYHPDDGTAEITVHYQPMMERLIDELDTRTEPFMQAVREFERLSETYIEVGENLNALLTPQTEADLADGQPRNLHAAVGRFHDVLDDTQTALQSAQNWLGDEELRIEARDAVINAGQLIEDASETLSQVGEFANRLEGRTDELVGRLLPVADELAAILEQTRQIAQLAQEGDGTISQLLNNPDLYNNLNDATIRLEQSLREVQLFIQKVRAEGLPVRWF